MKLDRRPLTPSVIVHLSSSSSAIAHKIHFYVQTTLVTSWETSYTFAVVNHDLEFKVTKCGQLVQAVVVWMPFSGTGFPPPPPTHQPVTPTQDDRSKGPIIPSLLQFVHLLTRPDFGLGSESNAESVAHVKACPGVLVEVEVQVPVTSEK